MCMSRSCLQHQGRALPSTALLALGQAYLLHELMPCISHAVREFVLPGRARRCRPSPPHGQPHPTPFGVAGARGVPEPAPSSCSQPDDSAGWGGTCPPEAL